MNCFKKKYNLIHRHDSGKIDSKISWLFLCCLFINSELVIADQCPTAEIIKDREISRDYEWTIDERRSLDDVLSVEKLYSVRIKNKGDFIACYYSGGKNLLRLDGKSLKKDCVVIEKSGSWKLSENEEQICKEEDLNLCRYEIHCHESNENNN